MDMEHTKENYDKCCEVKGPKGFDPMGGNIHCSDQSGSLPSSETVTMPDDLMKKLQKLYDNQVPMPADIVEILNEKLFDLT